MHFVHVWTNLENYYTESLNLRKDMLKYEGSQVFSSLFFVLFFNSELL